MRRSDHRRGKRHDRRLKNRRFRRCKLCDIKLVSGQRVQRSGWGDGLDAHSLRPRVD